MLKKIYITVIFVLFTILFTVSCAPSENPLSANTDKQQEYTGIYQYCTKDQQKFFDNFEADCPTLLIYNYNHETGEKYTVSDEKTIKDAVAALFNIQIETQTDMSATDSDDIFTFVMKDGTQYSFSFNCGNFYVKNEQNYYTVSGDKEFWKIARLIRCDNND